VGLLALDVSRFGVVMSADSQPVELFDGRTRVVRRPGTLNRNPIIVRRAGGFTGLLGYVGREAILKQLTRDWLQGFSTKHPTESLSDFCGALAEELTETWQRQRWRSALWIFVSGIEGQELRFWYVCNVKDVNVNGTYISPQPTFKAINDLDKNYIQRDLVPGQTKEQLLKTRMYNFRNGALNPSALIFDVFSEIMKVIYGQRLAGFPPIRSLDDLAFLDRQRMEFTKRLYSPKHGIAKATSAAIAGEVHVMGVTRSGEIREYPKLRSQVKTIPQWSSLSPLPRT
jgi:hypothetical protein